MWEGTKKFVLRKSPQAHTDLVERTFINVIYIKRKFGELGDLLMSKHRGLFRETVAQPFT